MKKQIHDSLSVLLTKKLEKHSGSRLNVETCTSIYRDIFDCILEVFQESHTEVSNEGVNLLAQMYYDSISIKDNNGGTQELDPNIFDKRAKLENLETKELAMMAVLFNGTPFAPLFIHAVKRRS